MASSRSGCRERYGVNKTARALGLDYYELKRRLDSGPGAPAAKEGAIGRFVEVVAAAPALNGECVVEVESAGGTKMRVHLKGRPEATWVRSLLFGGEER